MSPTNVPTRTPATIPPPWGRSRSITAWAMATPTHVTPSSTMAIPSVPPSIDGPATVSRKTTATEAASASRTCFGSPEVAATVSPISPMKPARRAGRRSAYIA